MPREKTSRFDVLASGGGFDDMPEELAGGAFSVTEAEHRILKRLWSIPAERGLLLMLKHQMRELLRSRLESCDADDIMLTRGQIQLLDEFFRIIQLTAEKDLETNAAAAVKETSQALPGYSYGS